MAIHATHDNSISSHMFGNYDSFPKMGKNHLIAGGTRDQRLKALQALLRNRNKNIPAIIITADESAADSICTILRQNSSLSVIRAGRTNKISPLAGAGPGALRYYLTLSTEREKQTNQTQSLYLASLLGSVNGDYSLNSIRNLCRLPLNTLMEKAGPMTESILKNISDIDRLRDLLELLWEPLHHISTTEDNGLSIISAAEENACLVLTLPKGQLLECCDLIIAEITEAARRCDQLDFILFDTEALWSDQHFNELMKNIQRNDVVHTSLFGSSLMDAPFFGEICTSSSTRTLLLIPETSILSLEKGLKCLGNAETTAESRSETSPMALFHWSMERSHSVNRSVRTRQRLLAGDVQGKAAVMVTDTEIAVYTFLI